MLNKFWSNREPMLPQRYVGTTLFRKHKLLRLSVRISFALILLALAISLMGCATHSPGPCETQPLPKPPALTEPLPLVSYSLQWKKLVQDSQKRLDDMQMTLPPVTQGGLNK